MEARIESETELTLVFSATANSGLPVDGQATLMPHLNREVRFASGEAAMLGEAEAEWSGRGVAGTCGLAIASVAPQPRGLAGAAAQSLSESRGFDHRGGAPGGGFCPFPRTWTGMC